jgi:hypothetical protein
VSAVTIRSVSNFESGIRVQLSGSRSTTGKADIVRAINKEFAQFRELQDFIERPVIPAAGAVLSGSQCPLDESAQDQAGVLEQFGKEQKLWPLQI